MGLLTGKRNLQKRRKRIEQGPEEKQAFSTLNLLREWKSVFNGLTIGVSLKFVELHVGTGLKPAYRLLG